MPKILIIGPAWVGDMVMAQSLFKVLVARHPTAEITVLAPAWSSPLLARMPEVRHTSDMPIQHGQFHLAARWKIAKNLAARGFDQAIVLPGSFKSALIPWFARIPRRTGFIGEQRWGVLNDIRKHSQAGPQQVQRYAALGYDAKQSPPPTPPHPQLMRAARASTASRQKFGLTASQPSLVLCPGAEFGPAKCWPASHFAEVARAQLQQQWQVWLIGSARDRGLGDAINGATAQRCHNLCGKTTLAEAVDLLAVADEVVTNDSGLMHVAAALDRRLIVLYGSSSDAYTPPLTTRAHRLALSLPCRPCFKRQCPLGHLNCLTQLPAARVIELLSN